MGVAMAWLVLDPRPLTVAVAVKLEVKMEIVQYNSNVTKEAANEERSQQEKRDGRFKQVNKGRREARGTVGGLIEPASYVM